jgi:Glycosyl transferases group 1
MAKKDISVITSLVGAGLEVEYLLLRDLLMKHNCYVEGIHYTDMNCALHPSDITIFMEVVLPRAIHLSRNNWFVPNSEWYDTRNDAFIPNFTKILCKTKDCYDIWCRKVGPEKCVYTSFEARDIYRPDVPRQLRCLHVAGKSEHKNTEAVCQAWNMTRCKLPPLTVVSRSPKFNEYFQGENPFPNGDVTHIARATDDEIIQMMNSHQIHIIPSMYEGFGHVIHEALGCGALVLTTDAPPMNTYDGVLRECLIPVMTRAPRSLAQLNVVSGMEVNEAVRRSVEYSGPEIFTTKSKKTREAFLANREFFRTTFMRLVDAI